MTTKHSKIRIAKGARKRGPFASIDDAIAAIRAGRMIIVVDDEDHFDVMIIPFTLTHTSLSSLQVGAKVNLECDVVGKYVARAVKLFGSA